MDENTLKCSLDIEQFCLFTDILPEPVLLLRDDLTICAANRAAQKMFSAQGAECPDLRGIPFRNLVSEEQERLQQWLKYNLRCAVMLPIRFEFLTAKGSLRLASESAVIRVANGCYIFLRVYSRENISAKTAGLTQQIAILHNEIEKRKTIEQQLLTTQNKLAKAYQQVCNTAKELSKTARLDKLTGVPNRRAFDEIYLQRWQIYMRQGTPLAVLLIDIDYFKLYNDTYGHIAGDTCLRKVAQAIQTQTRRASDFVARYGGEEFVVLANGDVREASFVAQAISEAVIQLSIPHKASPVEKIVTLSIGVCSTKNLSVNGYRELLESTDQALYAAKTRGRNRTIAAMKEEYCYDLQDDQDKYLIIRDGILH